MTYQETLNYMFTQLPMFQRTGKAAYKANLDNTLALDKYFGHPHRNFKCIHVAGTNGKGSVSHAIASVLQSAGFKVGLYTSPHLRDFRERIKINGTMLSEQAVVNFIEQHKRKFQEIEPSFFEMTVAMAFDYFAKEEVDIAVIEVGLGGRLDSTNIISPLVSVITNISKDHTNLLGSELGDIAREKAGIIKSHTPVIIGEKQAETSSIFIEKANEKESSIIFAEECYRFLSARIESGKQELQYQDIIEGQEFALTSDLLGSYQRNNIRTALCACKILQQQGVSINDENIQQGIASVVENTGLMGRWQILQDQPKIICDTGHNTAGIREIIEQINCIDYRNLHIVIGMVDDKAIDEVLKLLPQNARYYFTRASIPRALNEERLKVQAEVVGLKGNAYSSVQSALNVAKECALVDDLIFVGGSTFVVAEVV